MVLRRIGNKTSLADKIQTYFPKHTLYVEPFFGSGGMFFNKQKAKYNIVNDLDSDVYNLYRVIKESKEDFAKELSLAPYHKDLFDYWKNNKETDPIMQAVRFVYLSNFSFLGKNDTLRLGTVNSKKIALSRIDSTYELIKDVQFGNYDYVRFLKSFSIRNTDKTFIYADPPYIETANNYAQSFTKHDFIALLKALKLTKCRFAVSEFANEFVIEESKKQGLNITIISNRKSINNRNTEILIRNYKNEPTLF